MRESWRNLTTWENLEMLGENVYSEF